MEIKNKIIKNQTKLLFPSCISSKTHKIFLKYTNNSYRKYCLDIIRNLSQKLENENSHSIFFQTIIFQDMVLYNCGNEIIIKNLDLLILCCFYIALKSLNEQYTIPPLKTLKCLRKILFF